MLAELLLKWPLIRQIAARADGTGVESMSDKTKALRPKNEGAGVARSICPYCAVGCGQLIYHRDGKVVSIEGDPASPISRGHLCPKGADSFQLITHDGRATRVKYRAPRSRKWVEMTHTQAMELVAQRMWETRERSFTETKNGKPIMQCTGMAHLGGATLDIEENYLIKKLFTAGLGMVCVSNQARI
jgi:formate dehydrogenase major subunit